MPFLWFFFAMASGIISADFIHPELYISWGALLLLFLFFIGIETLKTKPGSLLGKTRFVFPLLLFFCLGQTLYLLEDPKNNDTSIEQQYLPGDKVLGEIMALSNTSGTYKKCEVEARSLIRYSDTIAVSGKILVFFEDEAGTLRRKDVCLMQADLADIINSHNPGEFDSREFWKHKSIRKSAFVTADSYIVAGRSGWELMDWFITLREKFAAILDRFMAGDENAVAKGLILGDRSSIDSEITRKFGNTGAMHVLAVSGLHVAILVQILTAFFSLFARWISRNQALILALAIVWIYSALTGLSASVVRSAVMFTILAGSTLSGKSYNGFNSLALSAVLILIWNPHFLYDIGFQLSYLAMAGIFLFNKSLSVLFYTRHKWIQAAWEGTMVGIAAQIMTVPLTLYYFHQFPNYFILTNLGLMVFSFLVLALGIALFVSVWLSPLAKLVAMGLTFSMFLMLWIIDFVDALPGSVSSGFVLQSWEVVLLFALILLLFRSLALRQLKPTYVVLAVTIGWIVLLVSDRFQRMEAAQVCFLQAREPVFIVKNGQQGFCFYGNKHGEVRKARFIAEAYSKVFPADLHYFEISRNKQTHVRFGKREIDIVRVRDGYSIAIGQKKYFYATGEEHDAAGSETIFAPWLTGNSNQLAQGSITFKLDP